METLIDRKKLARRWGLSTRTIDRMRDRGLLPFLKMGSSKRASIRFHLEDVLSLEGDRKSKVMVH